MTDTGPPGFNPFAPGFADDPYPTYARLRDHHPVEEHELGFWALWRHQDVSELLRSRLSVEDRNITAIGPMRQMYEEVYAEADLDGRRGGGLSMLDRDPPDHTRLRRLVAQVFTPRRVQELAPVVETLVDVALDRISDDGGCDLIEALAFPLPFQVITELLGMPAVDADRIRDLSGTLVRSLEPVPDVETLRQIVAAEVELAEIAAAAISWKRRHRGEDLLTALVEAEDAGDMLSDEELVAQVILLYVAGHETTVNLIGNGTYALLNHRDQLRLWRDRPDLDDNAVEELLRYDSPVQLTRRITVAPHEVDGHVIPPGRLVIGSLGSANRDPAVFGPDADRLRIDRENARQQVSFGAGVHHCLGAALARLEARVALGRLLRRFPDLEQAGEPVRNGRLNLRGLLSLPVAV